MSSGQYEAMGFKGEKKNCSICGQVYYKKDLALNNGKWVCTWCDDEEESK